jgi:hypothetical protein
MAFSLRFRRLIVIANAPASTKVPAPVFCRLGQSAGTACGIVG